MRRRLIACGLLFPCLASAMQDLGKLTVPSGVMAARCITMVSPQASGAAAVSTVVVRVVVSASGRVLPVRRISGAPALETEAMNAVRLWRYRPFVREGSAMDIVTDVTVTFRPGTPGGLISHPNR